MLDAQKIVEYIWIYFHIVLVLFVRGYRDRLDFIFIDKYDMFIIWSGAY